MVFGSTRIDVVSTKTRPSRLRGRGAWQRLGETRDGGRDHHA